MGFVECGSKDFIQLFVQESLDIFYCGGKLKNIKIVDRLKRNLVVVMEVGYREGYLGYCRLLYGFGCLIIYVVNVVYIDERWGEDVFLVMIFMILFRDYYFIVLVLVI